jgi:hypothetical protein
VCFAVTGPVLFGGVLNMAVILEFKTASAGYVDQVTDVEEMGGGMIVIDPFLDDWLDDWIDDGEDMAA